MLKDAVRPQNGDLVAACVRAEGVFPRVRHIAVFDYADGSQREFDGESWKVTRLPREVAAQLLS